ncbi:hypothetical protein CXX84_03620 [Arthrobacter sp. AFG7.2]|uniref:O-antigen ligase family protein n=1 Tax=Arthrobacter sp. AFG7.2 TaxID=1688693 RepID=UPI000C9DC5DC|nr:O-antigen ligase family protein [Arthrobacter sp. AFG7.2]PNI10549.1 hypothetical protein CXX84_03620 [Arthrobacter sp. AFG7.2]
MPILIYVVSSLALFIPLLGHKRVFLNSPGMLAAFFLLYLGPLAVMIARQYNLGAGTGMFACLAAGGASMYVVARKIAAGLGTGNATTLRVGLSVIVISMVLGSALSSASPAGIHRDLPTYFAFFFVAILLGCVETTRQFVKGALWVILATCTGSLALYATVPELVTTNYSSLMNSWLQVGRLTGPFGHPNALGSLAALGAALSLVLLESRNRYLAYGLCVAVVVLTDQRSALFAALACGFIDVVWTRTRSAFDWLKTSLCIFGLLGLLLANVVQDAVAEMLSRREASVESRQQVYDYIFSNLNEILPFGIGVNGLYERTARLVSAEGFAHAHNAWLTLLVAGGAAAALCFLLLTVASLLKSFRAQNRFLAIPLAACFVLCLAESPIFAGSNWTITSVAILSLVLLFQPLVIDRVAAWPRAVDGAPIQRFIDRK